MNSSESLLAWSLVPRAALAFLPVLIFLLVLRFFDSFRLVRLRRILVALAVGCACGLASYVINTAVLDVSGLPIMTFAVYVAPAVEEVMKALFIGWLVHTGRLSFMVEGAILGFGVGAGFSIIENAYYLSNLSDAPLLVWIIRGFGTAVMHAGVTGMLSVLLVGLSDRTRIPGPGAWAVGLLVAIVLHAGFNRALVKPIHATAAVVIILPIALRQAYAWGEQRLRSWLGTGFDQDTELLDLIREGQVRDTPLGRYLVSLRATFRPDTVADMLCLLRLQAELSIRAKGILLLREHGLKPKPDPEIAERLAELKWLENSIGKTGCLALRPIGRWQGRDRWQQYLLEEEG